MTKIERRIHKYLTKWQKNLRLNDWRISLQVVSKNDTNWNRDTYGNSSVSVHLKCATIRIAEPTDEKMDIELEATVIHELLHIHFDPYPWRENQVRDALMESVVDQLSIILLKLDNPNWVDPRHNV